jgi:hypothetical protein
MRNTTINAPQPAEWPPPEEGREMGGIQIKGHSRLSILPPGVTSASYKRPAN